jgi:hypothetical protein
MIERTHRVTVLGYILVQENFIGSLEQNIDILKIAKSITDQV